MLDIRGLTFFNKDGDEEKAGVSIRQVTRTDEELKEELQKLHEEAEALGTMEKKREEKQETINDLKALLGELDSRQGRVQKELLSLIERRAAMLAGFEEGNPNDEGLILKILKLGLDVEGYQKAKSLTNEKLAHLDRGKRYGKFKVI